MSLLMFGLTGGLASGKSSVAARFRARGLVVVDADELARRAVEPGSDALTKIAHAFGPSALTSEGKLDRARMSRWVFADPEARKRLESIVHPEIRRLARKEAERLEQAGHPLACYEAALLVERGLCDTYRPVVVVTVSEATQVARAMARDGATEADVRARIAAQASPAERLAQATYVLQNDGTHAELIAHADDVLDAICASQGLPPGRYPR